MGIKGVAAGGCGWVERIEHHKAGLSQFALTAILMRCCLVYGQGNYEKIVDHNSTPTPLTGPLH